MRAADLARELDLPANQMSFHLRQLAKYGLVEEDPTPARQARPGVAPGGAGRVLGQSHRPREEPGGKAASAVYRQHAAGWGHVVVDAAYADDRRDPKTFRTVTEQAVRLTVEEAKELAADLDEVVTRWLDRTVAATPSGRRTSGSRCSSPIPATGRLRATASRTDARPPAASDRGRGRDRARDRRPAAAHQALPRGPRAARTGSFRGGPGAAVRRRAGRRGGPPHPRDAPAVVEMDATTWVDLATGALGWTDAEAAGRVRASGERADLSPYLPLT